MIGYVWGGEYSHINEGMLEIDPIIVDSRLYRYLVDLLTLYFQLD